MSWDMRRLGLAIEAAAVILATAALVITGHWIIAICLYAWQCVQDVMFAYDWLKAGMPKK